MALGGGAGAIFSWKLAHSVAGATKWCECEDKSSRHGSRRISPKEGEPKISSRAISGYSAQGSAGSIVQLGRARRAYGRWYARHRGKCRRNGLSEGMAVVCRIHIPFHTLFTRRRVR